MKAKKINGRVLTELGRDELVMLVVELKGQVDDIDRQLEEMAKKYHETGERADENWFGRLRDARRRKAYNIQLVNAHLARLKRGGTTSYEREFITAARRLLAPDTYEMLAAEAREAATPC